MRRRSARRRAPSPWVALLLALLGAIAVAVGVRAGDVKTIAKQGSPL